LARKGEQNVLCVLVYTDDWRPIWNIKQGGCVKVATILARAGILSQVMLSGLLIAGEAQEIKIGVEQLWRGAEQAAADINAAGGINGMKLTLVKADDACEPKQAVAVANRLVDSDKVAAVVGHFCSASTIPASEVYAEANVLMITPASTNPTVTERKLPSILRTCGRDDQQGFVAAEFIVKNLKAKRVVVLHDKDTYGRGLADAMKTHMKSLGTTEVLYEGLTRGEKDFNALVTKIKAANADAVYFGGLHTEAGPLIRQMREQGLKAAFVSGDGIVSNDFVTTAGGNKFVNGVYMTFGADARSLPEGKKVVEEFRKGKYEPEGYTLYSYATIQAIAAALKATGKTDGQVLAKWLKANPVQTAMGTKAWDDKGDLKISDFVMYKWSDNGKYDVVKKM
jgi:branched-chain amino acid transport system substrate-binding protein